MSDLSDLDTATRLYAQTVVKAEKEYQATIKMAREVANRKIAEAFEACQIALELAEEQAR